MGTNSGGAGQGGASGGNGPGAFVGPGAGGGIAGALDVEPKPLQTISVALGAPTPHVPYTATFNGSPAKAGWSVDRGDAATIDTNPTADATFKPTGTAGGIVTVIAGFQKKTATRQVFIKLSGSQNGSDPSNPKEAQQIPTGVGDLTLGGGVGGVGGEGLGPKVTDQPTLNALKNPSGNGGAQNLKFLYPYDKTVWPRGLLAPLLMWDWSIGDADAIRIDLHTTSGSFSYSGTFGRPPILMTTGGKFIRMPVPQDIWDTATDTAGGVGPDGKPDQLVLELTVASGGMGYGPIKQTWNVAPARLAGTVYYNSYGTQLVKNSTDTDYNGNEYGAAVLGIKGGSTAPYVVAGNPTPLPVPPGGAGCRVCHVVASQGSLLIAQQGSDYLGTSSYDLQNMNAETKLVGYDNVYGWAGLTPDGKMARTNAAALAAENPPGNPPPTALYAFPPTSGSPLASTGIHNDLQAGAPAFSPDTKHVAFDFIGGTIGSVSGDGTQLVAMDFDPATLAFSNLTVLATMTGGKRAGFPSFFPTNAGVAFHYQIVNSNHRYNTWHGAQAQIWWSDLKTGTASILGNLNGLDGTTNYLPTGANNHANDSTLNYEPTVNPVVSGGYIWVVFTSRRLYGSVATTDPWLSDPRSYDQRVYANTTCKKLWVAAIDVGKIQNGKIIPPDPGSDPSHPAFYLPAQELVAGNARGFWVLDPCKADGMSCETGDQCCNGYCEPNGPGGSLVCSNKPPGSCSGAQEKCKTAADCCDSGDACINGFCTIEVPH